VLPRPAWIRARAPQGPGYERLLGLMRGLDLHTVCEEAHCPNLGECWSRGTATFMILGDVCTRACGFCAVKTGLPEAPPDPAEASRVGEAVARMGLRHAVVTSVNRDDRTDGGAGVFAATIAEIRARVPGCAVEVLIPDFKGRWEALQIVIDARPDILNHNVETVPRLYRTVRPGASFSRSLELLARSKAAGLLTKSGIMVGLGEERGEVEETIRAIRGSNTDILTVGQYLRPSPQHLPVRRYYSPDEFAELKAFALGLGYGHVESGPLVRSSYHADEHVPAGSAPAASGLAAPARTVVPLRLVTGEE
jgi:lipoic acid synthetase